MLGLLGLGVSWVCDTQLKSQVATYFYNRVSHAQTAHENDFDKGIFLLFIF